MSEQDSKVEELQKSLIGAIRLANRLHKTSTAIFLLKALDSVMPRDKFEKRAAEHAEAKEPPLKTAELDREILKFLRNVCPVSTSVREQFEKAVTKSFELAWEINTKSAATYFLTGALLSTGETHNAVQKNNFSK